MAEPAPPATQRDPLTAMAAPADINHAPPPTGRAGWLGGRGGLKPEKATTPRPTPPMSGGCPMGGGAPSSAGIKSHVDIFDAKQWQTSPRYRTKMLDMVGLKIGARWQAMELAGESGLKGAGDDAATQLVAWGLFASKPSALKALRQRYMILRVRPDYEDHDVLMILGHAWIDVAMVAKGA